MAVPVTRTKIIVPKPRSDLLSRPRLLESLEDLLDYPLTLISAPAGYGKTSLLIDLANQAEYPVCWLKIDSLDLEITRFLYHLTASIQAAFPSFGSRVFSITNSLENIPQDLDQITQVLVNEIYDHVTEHFVIILDDFHLVNEEPDISSFLNIFIQNMDDNCHLIIASRTQVDFPDLPLMVGRSQVKALGVEDLAFQAKEIQVLLNQKFHQEISLEESRSLADKTEGWITALLLSFQTTTPLPEQTRASRVTGVNLFNYLAQQVFDNQSSQIQEVLLRTSYLGEFNAGLCQAILGKPPQDRSWNELIQELLQENLFLQPLEDGSTWLRYHQLFEDFLQEYYRANQPEARRDLLLQLKDHYANEEQWEKAYAAAEKLADPELLAELIDEASSALFHSGRIHLLASWLDALPPAGFDHCPRLLILKGFSKTAYDNPSEGKILLSYALQSAEISSDPDLLIQTLIWRAATNRILGQYNDGLDDGLKALEISTNNIRLHAEAQREAGLSFLMLGNIDKAEELLSRSLNNYLSINDFNNSSTLHTNLGHLKIKQGNLEEAEEHFILALSYWSHKGNLVQEIQTLNNLGVISSLKGTYESSINYFKQAYKLSKEIRTTRNQIYILTSMGDLATDLNLFTIACGFYKTAKELANNMNEGYLILYIDLHLFTLYRRSNNTKKCQQLLLTSEINNKDILTLEESGYYYRERGLMFLSLGNHTEAGHNINRSIEIYKQLSNPIELAKSFISKASLCIVNKKYDQAENHINEATNSLNRFKSIKSIIPEISSQLSYLKPILTGNNIRNTVNKINEHINVFQNNFEYIQKVYISQLTNESVSKSSVVINAFGEPQVQVNGNSINVIEWTQQKIVRELLFLLLSNKSGFSKEEIGIIFWPDSSPSKLTCKIKNAMYRLRKAIGREFIIYDPYSRRYLFNRDLEFTYDVENFTNTIKEAQSEKVLEEQINKYRLAINLYKHPYNYQIYSIWAEPIRTNLFLQYEKAIRIVSNFEYENKNYESCIENCTKLLCIDPYNENIVELTMRAYALSGNLPGVIRTYKEFTYILQNDLKIKPSINIINTYKELLK